MYAYQQASLFHNVEETETIYLQVCPAFLGSTPESIQYERLHRFTPSTGSLSLTFALTCFHHRI